MSVIIFLIVLGALVFIHELGHFLVAKATKMRVDEFAIGFPPRLYSKKVGETEYSINALPLGGYVRIYGENPTDESASAEGSFTSKNRFSQALVLVAGVTFNILFAWVLIWIALMMGFIAPRGLADSIGDDAHRTVAVTGFSSEEAPVVIAGLELSDEITGLGRVCPENAVCASTSKIEVTSADEFIEFIGDSQDFDLEITYLREGVEGAVIVTPEEGILEDKKAIGISVEDVITIQSGPIKAIGQSFHLTGFFIIETFNGIWGLLADAVTGKGSLDGVSGPVGIVGIVGGAAEIGFSYLITLAAVISINLAVINIFPIPALDGGRLVFVIIESIIRKPIAHKFQVWANIVGFSALMLLMLFLTIVDITKL